MLAAEFHVYRLHTFAENYIAIVRILIFLIFGIVANAQVTVQGKVQDESGQPIYLAEVLVPEQKQHTVTDAEGNFSLTVPPGATVKVLKNGYHRADVKLRPGHSWYSIVLTEVPVQIEEIEIRRRMSGDLSQDLNVIQGSAKTRALREEVREYIHRPSAESVLRPRHDEFVQPVGDGASVTLWIDNKWTDVQYLEYLESYFGKDFFQKELGLFPTEVQPFVYFLLSKLEHRDILKYGRALPSDFFQFEKAAWQNINYFKYIRNRPAKK